MDAHGVLGFLFGQCRSTIRMRTLVVALFFVDWVGALACTLEETADFKAAVEVIYMTAMSVQDPEQRQADIAQALLEELDNVSPVCREELMRPVVRNERCERKNRIALDQNALQIEVANTTYLIDGDGERYFELVAAIHRNVLSQTPRECWLQGAAPPAVVQKPNTPPVSAACAQAWEQYNACKRQVEKALKRCTVTPGRCPYLGPTCLAPSCAQ